MSIAIAVFAKTPGLSPLKTRLAASIDKDKAYEFYRLSVAAIRTMTNETNANTYWAIAEEEGISDPFWQGCTTMHTGDGCLGTRQHHIYETLLKSHEKVLLIGADAPQISNDIIDDAIAALDTHDFTIGPAHDGGYYLFGGRVSTHQSAWKSTPWSTENTRKMLQQNLGETPHLLTSLTDVDTEDDLQSLITQMPKDMLPEQRDIVTWIQSLGSKTNL